MIVVDSDVLIDYLKGRDPSYRFLSSQIAQGVRVVTTTVNAAEVWRGALRARAPGEQRTARNLLDSLPQLPFGPQAAGRFGSMMAALDADGRWVPVVDGMIAAVALEASAPVVTGNIRHFDRIPGLVVRSPHNTS